MGFPNFPTNVQNESITSKREMNLIKMVVNIIFLIPLCSVIFKPCIQLSIIRKPIQKNRIAYQKIEYCFVIHVFIPSDQILDKENAKVKQHDLQDT